MDWEARALKGERRSISQEFIEKVRVLKRPGMNLLQSRRRVHYWRKSGLPIGNYLKVNYIIRDLLLALLHDKGLDVRSHLRAIPRGLRTSPGV